MQTITETATGFEWICPECEQVIENEDANIVRFDRGLHSCPKAA